MKVSNSENISHLNNTSQPTERYESLFDEVNNNFQKPTQESNSSGSSWFVSSLLLK